MKRDEYDSELGRIVAYVERYEATRDHYWLTRHYVAFSTLVTFLIAITAPMSLNAQAIESAGPVGWAVVTALALVSFAALFEAFVTAFAPGRTCEWLRKRRHTLYMLIAMGQLSLGYALVLYAPDSRMLILRFALDATVAAAVAFLDLFARHKAARYA